MIFDAWWKFQAWRWWWRLPVKGVIVGLTVFFVAFPNPVLFGRHVQRWRNPDALIEPDAPELAEMRRELEPMLAGIEYGKPALKVVEKYVYKKVPYAFDWDAWGVADYIPTVAEAVEQGREDCDGRAVVSASLLRGLGYQASLVTDFAHVWVKTDRGEVMGRGPMKKAVESRDGGIWINWSQLVNVPRSVSYGCAVFPLGRELIVLLVVAVLAIKRGTVVGLWLLAVGMLVGGLLVVRWAGANPWKPLFGWQWGGWGVMLIGMLVLLMVSRRAGFAVDDLVEGGHGKS